MPPKPARRTNQRQAIWPTHRLPNFTKNVYTTIWGPASQLLLLEAVANAIKSGKLDVWKKIKRHPFYYTTLGQAQYTPTQLKTNYNAIVTEDSETMSVGNTIIPMLKTQRRTQIPQDYIHLTQTNVVHPPLYGPRFGQADSDDEFSEPVQGEGEGEYVLNNNNTNTTAPPRQSLAIAQLSSMETPGFIARVEDTTMKALRGKLQGSEYQTGLMRARMDYHNNYGVDLDPVAIPPVDGINYVNLPQPPDEIKAYLNNFEIDQLQLLSLGAFFPTIQDEYRYIFQQTFSYYQSRLRPLSFNWHKELYGPNQQQIHADLGLAGWPVDYEPRQYEKFNQQLVVAEQEAMTNNTQVQIPPNPTTTYQRNAILVPKYANKVASLKTFLNNVIGMPLWYAITVTNFFFELQAPQHYAEESLDGALQCTLHAYQRQLLTAILHNFFSQYQSGVGLVGGVPVTGIAMVGAISTAAVNPKDRFQAGFVGGGRHYESISALTQDQHADYVQSQINGGDGY